MTAAEHVQRIAEVGWTVVPAVLDDAACDALLSDLDRLEGELGTHPATNSFEGTNTTRVYNLLAYGPLWQAIPVEPRVLGVVEGVLDAGCLISSLSSVCIRPGEIAQPIHADDQMIPLPKPHPPTVCNSMWALTPFTELNGATPDHPGHARGGSLADVRQALRLDSRRDGAGLGARVARQPVARRGSERQRRTARRDRDELLRRLHPPAGESAARPEPGDGADVRTAPPPRSSGTRPIRASSATSIGARRRRAYSTPNRVRCCGRPTSGDDPGSAGVQPNQPQSNPPAMSTSRLVMLIVIGPSTTLNVVSNTGVPGVVSVWTRGTAGPPPCDAVPVTSVMS